MKLFTRAKSPVITEKRVKTQSDFTILKNVNETLLLVDKVHSICVLKWRGRVDIETATEILTLAGAAATLNRYTKILIDRSGLIEFDNEARIWIDSWIKTKAKNISHNVDKIAIVNSEAAFGNMFNNVFNAVIALAFPRITTKKFPSSQLALKWLSE